MLARRAGPYVIALLSVAVATLVGLPLYPAANNFPVMLLVAAVAISGSVGGLGPAIVGTIASLLSLDYFFEDPRYSLAIQELGTSLDLLVFLLVAFLLGALTARLRTAQRRANIARLQAEVALKSRDEALAIVSHDLRTPLTAIKTSVSTLRNPGAPLGDTTRRELLGTIEAEADRLVRFVSDALAVTRLEGGIVPDLQWNALGEIVSAALDRVTPVLGDRPVTFDVPDTLPLARFDAGLLDQALSNVLENVGVHTPPGSPLEIVGRVAGGTVRVEVSDGGPGIPVSERMRVLDKFERLDNVGAGTGLGLAIARAAAEAQGGQVRIEDSPLGGVRVVVQVPSVTAAGAPDAA